MLPEFFRTEAGKKYIHKTLPENTAAMNRLAAAIEKQNELAEASLAKPGHPGLGDPNV